jgi:hypothetical protein
MMRRPMESIRLRSVHAIWRRTPRNASRGPQLSARKSQQASKYKKSLVTMRRATPDVGSLRAMLQLLIPDDGWRVMDR